MSHKEESLDEKIARIRRQNEEIERRKKLIDEEIKDAERNNAILKLKNRVHEADLNDKFGATLYSDQLTPEKKVVKSFEEDIWNVKPRPRKSASQSNKTDEEWREERKRIDEERIRRQKANSGSWKREWDADKTASSNDHDNRTSQDVANRYNRNSSIAERPDIRGTYNESRGSYNHHYTNEDDNTQNRWKTDSSFRKTYSERRSTDNYDNRKSNRNDSWRTNVSESDQYNNNTTKSFSKNISRGVTQNAPFTTKNSQLEEESWDDVEPNLKINSQNDTQITPFATKNNQFKEENWDTELVKDLQSVKPKSNNWNPLENSKPQVKSQGKDRLSAVLNGSRFSCGFNNRIVQPNRSSNASNLRISKSPEIKRKITGGNDLKVNDCETSGIILNDLEKIVVQVGNLGISSGKREVKKFGDLKSDSNVPKFSFNMNTSREVDSKTSPSYGSMTFERSDLKQKRTPTYSENLSSSSSIATQLFSNSKLSDVDANTKLSNFTRTVKNDEQKSTTMCQSPTVFQFTATPSKPDFGDIVHNITTPQDVKIIRTIRSENIMLVKESPKRNISTEIKKTKDAKENKDIRRKTNEVKRTEVVLNEESEGELDEDEEWDDCSDEEVEEEFI